VGLAQAFFMTNVENYSIPTVIKTKTGFIAYSSIQTDNGEGTTILLTLIGKLKCSSSEQSSKYASNILYFIRNLIIFHIGVKDFENVEGDEIARVKTQI
jgi:hypothetical protein